MEYAMSNKSSTALGGPSNAPSEGLVGALEQAVSAAHNAVSEGETVHDRVLNGLGRAPFYNRPSEVLDVAQEGAPDRLSTLVQRVHQLVERTNALTQRNSDIASSLFG